MKRIAGSIIVAFCALAISLFALPQKHSPVAPGARETTAKRLHSMLDHNERVMVIDVRTPEEYARGHIPEAINIPINELPQKLKELHISKQTTIVTMCDHGGRSSRAALELQRMGYKTTSFCQIDSWEKDGYKIKKGKARAE